MRSTLLAFGLAATVAVGSASAADIQIRFDDAGQRAVMNLPGAFDQCIAGLSLRGDATACKAVSQFLSAQAQVVVQAQREAADKEAAEKAAAAVKPEPKP